MKTMTLVLDNLDYATIQKEIAARQLEGRTKKLPLKKKTACLAGR